MSLSKVQDPRLIIERHVAANRRGFNRIRVAYGGKRAAVFRVLYLRMRRGSAAERSEEPHIRGAETREKFMRLRRLWRNRRYHTPDVNVAVRELLFEERARRGFLRHAKAIQEAVEKTVDTAVLLNQAIAFKEAEIKFLGELERAVSRYVIEARREGWLVRLERLRAATEKRLKALRELELEPVTAMREVTVYLNYIPQMTINRLKAAGVEVTVDRATGRGRGATAEFEYKVFRWVEEARVNEYKQDTIDLWFDVFFWFSDFRAQLAEDLDPNYGITNRSDEEVKTAKVDGVKAWCAAAKIRTVTKDVVWRGCGKIDEVRFGRPQYQTKLETGEKEEIGRITGYDVMRQAKCVNYHQGIPV